MKVGMVNSLSPQISGCCNENQKANFGQGKIMKPVGEIIDFTVKKPLITLSADYLEKAAAETKRILEAEKIQRLKDIEKLKSMKNSGQLKPKIIFIQ